MFQLQKRLPKWRQRFFKNGKKKTISCQKAQSFVWFGPYDFVQIALACSINIFLKECRPLWRDFRLSMSALATVKGKNLTANLLQKLIYRSGILCYTVHDADIGSLKSLQTLFNNYLDHMLVKFEQNSMVQIIQNIKLLDKNG